MKIVVASDHGGFDMKNELKLHLDKRGFEVTDFGSFTPERAEYPEYGEKAARAVASGAFDFGVLVCGTGCGISLSANRVKGIRCCNCSEPVTARLSREHNNCNMVAIGGRIVGMETAIAIVDAFVTGVFETGGRHEQRVKMIESIDRN